MGRKSKKYDWRSVTFQICPSMFEIFKYLEKVSYLTRAEILRYFLIFGMIGNRDLHEYILEKSPEIIDDKLDSNDDILRYCISRFLVKDLIEDGVGSMGERIDNKKIDD